VRTILSGNTPLDRYMNGEREALSPQARQGLGIFRGKGNCTACHVGPTLTDEQFHNTGVAWKRPRSLSSAETRGSSDRGGPASAEESGALVDLGRFAVTGRPEDRGAFKTPTLREIARTAPYMHDGSFVTLDEVLEFYDRGGNANPFRDRELRPLGLSEEEKQALLAFLHSLTGDIYEGPGAGVVDRK
jgi:cytochrome c peroxidase